MGGGGGRLSWGSPAPSALGSLQNFLAGSTEEPAAPCGQTKGTARRAEAAGAGGLRPGESPRSRLPVPFPVLSAGPAEIQGVTVPQSRGAGSRGPAPHFPAGGCPLGSARWTVGRGARAAPRGCPLPGGSAHLTAQVPVLWLQTPNLSARGPLAHFRRQPPGPPGPLAEQPRMTSAPARARRGASRPRNAGGASGRPPPREPASAPIPLGP